jgi:hypothetical protein
VQRRSAGSSLFRDVQNRKEQIEFTDMGKQEKIEVIGDLKG